ncbi:ABC transporter ATP binding protein [Candidatus Photodesmus blepharus]|uniref:ABC transporter ATP binding protein n=1 Tax=Candidatus Photodesmus blepharonis TaxID=1179155 RepID=A0A084CN69_9GAMM|nr:ABC transporter ATP-binding protein [Candidatus Photodesmus blepharus]KEY91248.1 ABC transporter ATP binding protein [Candidatus Photodesmus blepharus]
MSFALSVQNLTYKYDSQIILKFLSLDVKHGEILCLLGVSGCGKTTLLKVIAGLLPLTSGVLSLNSRILDDGKCWLPPERRNIGMIFQDYALFPHLTVAENIAFGLHNMSANSKVNRVNEMLMMVRLSNYASRFPHQLSGGQQQRIAIARSLAYKPDLLLLDEPFSNIDPQVRYELISEIRKVFKVQGVTAIFVTHSREEAFAFADKMAIMNHGMIEQCGLASELYYHPVSRFVADFLGVGSYLSARKISKYKYQTEFGVIETQAYQHVYINSDCELLLRPEQVQIKSDSGSNAKVLEQQFMGGYSRYMIELNGKKLLSNSYEDFKIGQMVSVKLDTQDILVF